MFRIFQINKSLIVYKKTEKEFKQKYGSSYEQVGIVKDMANLDAVVEKLKRQYKADDVVYDFRKTFFSFKDQPLERQLEIRRKNSESNKKHVRTPEHCAKISANKKGKSMFAGRKHKEESKRAIARGRLGKDPIKGKKWAHDPFTGEEKRLYELVGDFQWGRSKEMSRVLGGYLIETKKRLKQEKVERHLKSSFLHE